MDDDLFDQHTPIWLLAGCVLGLEGAPLWLALGLMVATKAAEGLTGAGGAFTEAAHGPVNALGDALSFMSGWAVGDVLSSGQGG